LPALPDFAAPNDGYHPRRRFSPAAPEAALAPQCRRSDARGLSGQSHPSRWSAGQAKGSIRPIADHRFPQRRRPPMPHNGHWLQTEQQRGRLASRQPSRKEEEHKATPQPRQIMAGLLHTYPLRRWSAHLMVRIQNRGSRAVPRPRQSLMQEVSDASPMARSQLQHLPTRFEGLRKHRITISWQSTHPSWIQSSSSE
jgi:hypothetical protein